VSVLDLTDLGGKLTLERMFNEAKAPTRVRLTRSQYDDYVDAIVQQSPRWQKLNGKPTHFLGAEIEVVDA
jgi:hypothetical protein